ncbi:hypothetical protein, partial [Bradyrhizobium sp. CSS354]|uniref:hypothetical protein n=1 Tax=Bradyrhizobium sp. CSS354 TaxID=2699172 RepID=UPI0023AEA5CE
MKLTLPKVALLALATTAAFSATSANAAQFRTYGCDSAFFEGCGIAIEQPTPSGRSRVSITHDTSPTYMKQTDPRYSSSMRDAGGGGG